MKNSLVRSKKIEELKTYDFRKDNKHNAAFGYICELSNASEKSRKTTISPKNKSDNTIKIMVNGKIKYMPLETKTNRGKIDSLIKKYNEGKNGYIAYAMDICNSNTQYARRKVPMKLFSLREFIGFILENNLATSTKKHGEDYGTNIQATNIKFFEYVENNGIPYNPNDTYNPMF